MNAFEMPRQFIRTLDKKPKYVVSRESFQSDEYCSWNENNLGHSISPGELFDCLSIGKLGIFVFNTCSCWLTQLRMLRAFIAHLQYASSNLFHVIVGKIVFAIRGL